MHAFPVFALSVGLAMDAMAVSASRAVCRDGFRFWNAVRMVLLFGAFQAGMPILGWAIGGRFAEPIQAWDHWVAFALLSGIGAKMIYEVIRRGPFVEQGDANQVGWWSLVVLSVATSVDALAAGLTLPLLNVSILVAATAIGVTTAMLSAVGVYIGHQFGGRIGGKLDVLGGLLIIAVGAKILIEHTLAS